MFQFQQADPSYFWYVFIPTVLMSLGVHFWLKRTFKKWSKIENSAGATGKQVTEVLFEKTSLNEIPVKQVRGRLTDYFDSGKNVVNLSNSVYGKNSVAAMAVSAHELGHVQQYQTESTMIKMRSFLVPAVMMSPRISYLCLMVGLLFNITGWLWVGIFFFGLTVVFSLLTIPVETNASKRALSMLDETGLRATESDKDGSQSVLRAAAMTYLAAAVSSVITLVYYVIRVDDITDETELKEQKRKSIKAGMGSASRKRKRSKAIKRKQGSKRWIVSINIDGS